MEKVFIDTNFIIEFLNGNEKVVGFFGKNMGKLVSNILVFLETLHVLQKLKTKYPDTSLNIAENLFASLTLLPVDFVPLSMVMEMMEKYGLKSNDALIAATCRLFCLKARILACSAGRGNYNFFSLSK